MKLQVLPPDVFAHFMSEGRLEVMPDSADGGRVKATPCAQAIEKDVRSPAAGIWFDCFAVLQPSTTASAFRVVR